MSVYYATCHTPDNNDPDRRIQGLGGPVMGWLNVDTIILLIDQGHTFYTQPPHGSGQQIITAIHPVSHRRYIKTVSDGIVPNNILALPRCP
jgi:hypothetical protein